MLVNKNQMQHIAMLTDIGGQDSIKRLSQSERKAVRVVMDTIQTGQNSTTISLNQNEYTVLTDKLWAGVGAHKTGSSFILISFFKGLGNLLGITVSSKELAEKAARVTAITPNAAAKKLKQAIEPLVAAKKLTIDYFDTKMPQVAIKRLLGQEREADAIEEHFQREILQQLDKLKNVFGLSDAVIFAWKYITSSDTREAVQTIAERIQTLITLNQALTEHDTPVLMRFAANQAGLKEQYVNLLNDLIQILKTMNQSLARA